MRGATIKAELEQLKAEISIHAPHAGCDTLNTTMVELNDDFNPRTPCGVRPLLHLDWGTLIVISIHAPHAGCDWKLFQRGNGHRDFNPRTPCGVRRNAYCGKLGLAEFQSTHPMRGATARVYFVSFGVNISIHAPHAGCDGLSASKTRADCNFNPRTPCGVRQGI